MRTEVKAAIAGTVGVVLLLGGAGTLAYWSDSGTASGTTVRSGTLSLSDPDCDPGVGTTAVWTVNGAASFDPATDLVVPGDTLVLTCTFTIGASGKNLTANIATTGGLDSGALSGMLTTTSTYTVNGLSATTVSSGNDGHVLAARIEVAFPYGTTADNSSQALNAAISDYVVTLTQVNPAP